ncbi:MAG: PAS domain S-box protein, partial [Desulfatitalea sp.]|nr:PAS domain S-box protein [Desulfatitalea sp.]NNK02081.1 PAS domain S-box protein [Desulfatitalea sp.]
MTNTTSSSRSALASRVDSEELKIDRKLKRLSGLFGILGSDAEQNIHTIVEQSCRVLGSACSMYNRIDKRNTSLACWAGYDLPPGFPPENTTGGQICFETTIKTGNQTVALGDLSKTPYAQSDPLVRKYGLKSYLGHAVQCNNKIIGALCVVDTRTRHFDKVDAYIISALAKSLSLEEERKEAQEALRSSENRHRRLYKMLRLIADNVPDLIWAKDLDDRYIFANQALCEKLLKCGRPEDAIGKTDIFFAEREKEQGHQHTFYGTGFQSDQIIKEKRTSGRFLEQGLVRNENLILDVHKAPIWDENGELIGTVGCGRDVTCERHTTKALLESEKRYEDLYNSAPVMLYSLDRQGCLTSVSNMWLKTMGYSRDEVLGRPALDFFAPECRRSAKQIIFPRFYESGRIKSRPFQFLAKDGKIKDIMLSAIAQRDEQGNYTGALAFMVDITQAKESEKDQRRLTARLQQAQKMEAIATLAGGIAHQFNNALAVILGNIELIQMDGLADAKVARFIEPINQAGQKMVQLTSQLLAYARGGKFQTQVVPAYDFVREALSLVSHSIASYVELKIELDPNVDAIEVDRTQMQMLLSAILSNASEAIEKEGSVTVGLKNVNLLPDDCIRYQGLTPGRHVLLQIIDSGKGMDEATRERIFEPFFTTKFQGRGLGMAAVYGIVKKHGGYAYVDSTLGQG